MHLKLKRHAQRRRRHTNPHARQRFATATHRQDFLSLQITINRKKCPYQAGNRPARQDPRSNLHIAVRIVKLLPITRRQGLRPRRQQVDIAQLFQLSDALS